MPQDTPLGRRTNCLFLGTSVVSGTARLLVVRTGRDTEFGQISGSLRLRPPETGFERGIRRFGYLLLEKDLRVLERGVREGRVTLANTMKYIFMATSANFGNMFSMAGASLFLSFLPLLPKQVLLVNLLTDLPEMTIATDSVDPEIVERPRRWTIGFIRRFMIVFGEISSAFDFLTFGVLVLVLHAREAELRTGWFVESVVSAALIVLVVRTRRTFYRSRPSRPLLIATLAVAGLTLLLPYSPLAPLLGFVPLPPIFLVALGPIVLLYLGTAEAAKSVFHRREEERENQTALSFRSGQSGR